MSRRITTGAAVAAAVLLLATACGGDKKSHKSDASSASTSATPSASATATTSASPTPTWMAKYTPTQLKQYDAAVAAWHKYEKAAAPIWAVGQVTPHARMVFNKYLTPANAKAMANALALFQKSHQRMVGQQKVLWIHPLKIEAGRIELSECVDYSMSKVTVNGVATSSPFTGPVLRSIGVASQGEHQSVAIIRDPQFMRVKIKPCSPGS